MSDKPKTTITGRISNHEPSLQNILVHTEEGRRIKSAFMLDHRSKIVEDAVDLAAQQKVEGFSPEKSETGVELPPVSEEPVGA